MVHTQWYYFRFDETLLSGWEKKLKERRKKERTKGTFQMAKKAAISFTIPFHLCVKSVRFSICVSVGHDDGKRRIKKLHQENNKFLWGKMGEFSSWAPSSMYFHLLQTFFHCFKGHSLVFAGEECKQRKLYFRSCPVAQCSVRWFNGLFWPKFYAVTHLTLQMRFFHLHSSLLSNPIYGLSVQCF